MQKKENVQRKKLPREMCKVKIVTIHQLLHFRFTRFLFSFLMPHDTEFILLPHTIIQELNAENYLDLTFVPSPYEKVMQVSISSITIPLRTPRDLHQKFAPHPEAFAS